jgi:hypothetical protein
MTIQEFHINLDIVSDRMGAKIFAGLGSEKKDILIYNGTLKYIDDRIAEELNVTKKGFEFGQIRIDELEELKTSFSSPVYKDTFDDNVYFVPLPSNYKHHIRSKVIIYTNCNKEIKINLENKISKVAPVYYKIGGTASKPSANIDIFGVVVKDNTGTETLIYKSTLEKNIYSEEANFDLLYYFINDFNQRVSDIKVRYEHCYGVYLSNNLFFTSDNLNYTNIKLVKFSNLSNTYVDITGTDTNFVNKNFTVVNPIDDLPTEDVSTIVTSSTIIDKLLKTPFYKSQKEGIRVTIEKGLLKIFTDKLLIPKELKMTYLRMPQINNIFANISCELNPNVHYKVLEAAISIAATVLTPANYEILKRDLQIK